MSLLADEIQEVVDMYIKSEGLKGIGYYKVDSYCENCRYKGFTIFKIGTPANFDNCFCVKCGSSEVRIREDQP